MVRTSTRRSGTRWTWTGRTTLSATGSRNPTGRTNSPFIVIQKRTLTLSSSSPKTTVSVHECLASRYLDKSFDHEHSAITLPVARWRQDLSYPLQESDRITLPNVPMFVSIPPPATLIAMMVTILVTNKMVMFCASGIFIALILEHKTFALAINRDYLSTVFTSDHKCTV